MYDPLELCEVEEREGKTWHVANPAKVIPATMGRIMEVVGSPWSVNLPVELVNYDDADPSVAVKGVVEEVIALLADGKPYAAVWAWFRRALSMQVGKSILLHITKDVSYQEA